MSRGGSGLRQAQIDMTQFNIHFVIFFFLCANLWGAQRKETNRNTHESIIAVIQWLSMNSKYVCKSFGELGWWGFGRVWRRNTATYRRVWKLQAPGGLHHHIDRVDVFLRQRGSCSVHSKDAGVRVGVYMRRTRNQRVNSWKCFLIFEYGFREKQKCTR